MAHRIYRCENPEELVDAANHASARLSVVVRFMIGHESYGVIVAVIITYAALTSGGIYQFEGRFEENGMPLHGTYDRDARDGELWIGAGSFSMPPVQAP